MSAAAEDDAAPAWSPPTPAGLKLRRLELEDFKAFDHLELDLPGPLMDGDPDVFVIGSANGIGKTTLLEACALLAVACLSPALLEALTHSERYPLGDYLIRAGARELRACGTLFVDASIPCELVLTRENTLTVHSGLGQGETMNVPAPVAERGFLAPLFADAAEPFVVPRCLYFHSNRRIKHGPIRMDEARSMGDGVGLGWIKHKILHFLLAQAGLFEDIRASSVDDTARILEELFRDFAEARLAKLRAQPNNALDIRVQPLRGGESFSFDALSSGQKEMITTLFLIWHHTLDNPGLVLIDEPELHLNAEWQVKFIRLLFKIAPQNQYIFATHSEFIFRSVQEDRRLLIDPQG